jgi:NAD(P)-dependent dehydrogenase (short-subunit alcohol dehydrogenase family)
MTSSPFPSWTKTWHNTSYADISTSRPELSTKGKSVVISGGGAGIGAAMTRGFAAAGSTEIAILGRRLNVLQETAKAIEADYPGTKVLTVASDIVKAETVDAAFDTILKAFGKIDIAVSNAGYLSEVKSVKETNLDDWWTTHEINTKGAFNIARAFLRHAKPGSTLLHTTTGMGHMPTLVPGHSGYVTSKLAAAKLHEYIAEENPDIHVVMIQPGVIKTDMSEKSGFPGLDDSEFQYTFIPC